MGITIHYTIIASSRQAAMDAIKVAGEEAIKRSMNFVVGNKIIGYAVPFISKTTSGEEYLKKKYGMKEIPVYGEDEIPSVDETVVWLIRNDLGRNVGYGHYLFFPEIRHKDGTEIPRESFGIIKRGDRGDVEDFALFFFKAGGKWIADGFVKTRGYEPYHSNVLDILLEISRLEGVTHVFISDEKSDIDHVIDKSKERTRKAKMV